MNASIAIGKNQGGSFSSSHKKLVDTTTSFAANNKADDKSIATNKSAKIGEVDDKLVSAKRSFTILVQVAKIPCQ